MDASRRDIVQLLGMLPLAGMPIAARSESASDRRLLAAWEDRQAALARSTTRGAYADIDTHSPIDADIIDGANEFIVSAQATTVEGVIAKAWVALAMNVSASHPSDTVRHDAFRRANLAEVDTFAGRMDIEEEAIFAVIRDLELVVLASSLSGY